MKRRRSPELAVERPQKRVSRGAAQPVTISRSFVRTLQQYGLLECIVSRLSADDLLALALSSKTIYSAIFPRPGSLENILKKVSCDGKGVQIRNRRHRLFPTSNKSRTKYVQCGTVSNDRKVESRPCIRCKGTTCNECRIHCVYQSIYEASAEEDELPEFGGFVLLEPAQVNILSPHHLQPDDAACRWQDPMMSVEGPYHDQGFLDLPLESIHYGPPERIETILDLDLGQYSLTTFSASSHFGNPSPVFRALCEAIDVRKLDLCFACFESQAPKGPGALHPALPQLTWLETAQATGPIQPCHCTLRKHIVDRWVCLRCYEGEVHAMTQATSTPCRKTGLCRCGSHDTMHTLCMWCWGEVTEEDTDEGLIATENA
jgi:hypothetical protein